MKIAFLTASVSRRGGGVFPALRRMASELSGLGGLNLSVLGLADEYTAKDAGSWNGVDVRTYRVAGPRSFGFAPDVRRGLTVLNPDLVHTHGLWMYPSVAAEGWTRRTAKPHIVSPHGMLDPWALGNSAWKKRLGAWLYENRNLRRAGCIHALCESEAASVREYGLSNPVCVLPNGVDLPCQRPSAAPRWAGGLPEGSRVVLYLGRLHPKKGLLNLVRACASVALAIRKDWILVIAGWDQGGHEAEVKRLVCELGVEAAVRFVGPEFGEDKEASFRRAEAFVLPSFSEGLPVGVLEAWAYGLPVVMTPHCNLPEGFQAEAAIRVEPEADSIARGLTKLFAMTDAERRAVGERGRRLVEERFSWPKIARQMKDVYEWMLGGGQKPACVRMN